MNRLRKLRATSWSERWLLFEALVWLGMMRAAIHLFPFRRIADGLGLTQGADAVTLDSVRAAQAACIGWAVHAVAARVPWLSTCLVESLAAVILLQRRGIPATLYLGVAKDTTAPEKMVAHAWLRCGDGIVAGAHGRERFTVVSTFCAANPAKRDLA
ncbi:MAG: lasso peptide biosynthesis B2 protein [Chloroflexi bacterium]|nr:lasso peptide biosynthesis B2 protein [Chloroflexota bacterium]